MSISFSHIAKTVPEKANVCPIGRGRTKPIPQEGENHGTNPKHRAAHHRPL